MGGVNLEGGGKRTLDFELNLVPFIDLLSCCISFLLITAVWTQMGKLETTQKLDGGGAAGEKPAQVDITVAPSGYELRLPDEPPCTLSKTGQSYDEKALRKVLDKLKRETSSKVVVRIAAVDELPFSVLVDVMDVCAELGLKSVSLNQLMVPPQGGPRCKGG
jgi:biopolymer transport protein TolR